MADRYVNSKVNKVCWDCYTHQEIKNKVCCDCGGSDFTPAKELVVSKKEEAEMTEVLWSLEYDDDFCSNW